MPIPNLRLNIVELNVTFNGNQLESLMVAKNLGVYFDNNLNMSKQIKLICSTGYSSKKLMVHWKHAVMGIENSTKTQ